MGKILDEILQSSSELTPDNQQKVLGYIHSLKNDLSESSKTVTVLSGLISEADAKELTQIIEQHCEQVHAADWTLPS
ncbi:MAG: hypothetical protein JNJ85_12360 [Candidatus Kapabacteria bacterium]|nr:hypothetical protein [Candidatus Kapabacteria bacterium]MBX7153349.1 hypothetical protein [Bacteroidota bacterium]